MEEAFPGELCSAHAATAVTMIGRIGHRRAAPYTAASTSTSSKPAPDEDLASASEESGNEEQDDASLSSRLESDGDGLAEGERQLERVLANVPFGEMQRDASASAAAQKKARLESRKRPMEISTNVWPPRFREVMQVPKKL